MKRDYSRLKALLREFILEQSRGGSHPEESYNKELLSDPAYKSGSVYVPDDIKDKIDKWAEDMGLKSKGKKRKG